MSGLFSMIAAAVVVFALSSGQVCSAQSTQSISGMYIGVSVNGPTGPRPSGVGIFLMQFGNQVYVSTDWGGQYIYNGSGTISGNTLTFQVTQADLITGTPKVLLGTATINAGRMTGITIMPEVGNSVVSDTVGAFSTTMFYPM
jgi:hypothetical protein